MKDVNSLVILTHKFPLSTGEEFLSDELDEISAYFEKIVICPVNSANKLEYSGKLPSNVRLAGWDNSTTSVNNYKLALRLFPILFREFFKINSGRLYFSTLKYNLSLLKQCYLNALNLKKVITDPEHTMVYSYWCDDLALTGAFCKSMLPCLGFVSRAHGFDVFEEQSDFRYIFFRSFQLSALDRLWAVSEAGAAHLKMKNPAFVSKIDYRHLGIHSDGSCHFEDSGILRIVTCSHVRSIKRLDLLMSVLKQVTMVEIEWHVIGDGPDLNKLKLLSDELPKNCKVVFHGLLRMEAIHELYSKVHFDLLISLSSSEGLPVSMMEAISHGIPVVATDVGGCREIVNETTGILIPMDFQDSALAHIFLQWKYGKFNNKNSREEIVSFWKSNFNAKVNYRKFAEELKSINHQPQGKSGLLKTGNPILA